MTSLTRAYRHSIVINHWTLKLQ